MAMEKDAGPDFRSLFRNRVSNLSLFRSEQDVQMAAYPTSYEFPYCPECKTLRDAGANAQDYVRSFRPPDPGKSRSRWPKAYQDEM